MGHTRFATLAHVRPTCGRCLAHMWQTRGTYVADNWPPCGRQLAPVWQSTGTEMAIRRRMHGSEQAQNWPMCGNCPGPQQAHIWQSNRYINSPVHLFQNTLRPPKNCNRIVINGFVFSNYLKTTYTKSAKIESAIAA